MKKRETIEKKYIEFELLEGRSPNSVFEFMKYFKASEKDFYVHYNSLEQLRKKLLEHSLIEVFETLDKDENYASFSAREKALALFYTLFERWKENRSYLLSKYQAMNDWKTISKDWDGFMNQLEARMENILLEAKQRDEVIDRPAIGKHYAKGFKLAFVYLLRVWFKDESHEFETTDAAIEKTVNLTFDMLGKGPLDSLIDFGRFAIKTKVM